MNKIHIAKFNANDFISCPAVVLVVVIVVVLVVVVVVLVICVVCDFHFVQDILLHCNRMLLLG